MEAVAKQITKVEKCQYFTIVHLGNHRFIMLDKPEYHIGDYVVLIDGEYILNIDILSDSCEHLWDGKDVTPYVREDLLADYNTIITIT